MTEDNKKSIKHIISKKKGIFIEFHQTENGKYYFTSNNDKVKAWIDNVKKKLVKNDEFYYVVRDAGNFYYGSNINSLVNKNKEVDDEKWKIDPTSAMNEYCQKNNFEVPEVEFSTIQENGRSIIHGQIEIDNFYLSMYGSNKKDVKKDLYRHIYQKHIKEGRNVLLPKTKEQEDKEKNPVAILNNLCQKKGIEQPTYEVLSTYQKGGETSVTIGFSIGNMSEPKIFVGRSAKEARSYAASWCLEQVEKKNEQRNKKDGISVFEILERSRKERT